MDGVMHCQPLFKRHYSSIAIFHICPSSMLAPIFRLDAEYSLNACSVLNRPGFRGGQLV
jgi:hypothetical protein